MKIQTTPLTDCFVLQPEVYHDKRGHFFESFNKKRFESLVGFEIDFVQDNQSVSSFGVLRGMHFQIGEMAQSKLVRVICGKVLDIVVDLRKDSETFGKSFSIILDASEKLQLFIPKGFAHGFVTLSEKSVFAYKCDNYYDPKSERGIIYNDATLRLDWHLPKDKLIVSEKDQRLPSFKEIMNLQEF